MVEKDNLIQADAEPDLSQSGQQSSVPTKTMERIAYDAYRSKVPGAVQWSDILSRDGWRAAADAVIEECAKALRERRFGDITAFARTSTDMEKALVALTIEDGVELLRSLKSNPKGDENDAG